MGCFMGFTLWSFNVAIENGPVEIVALPMKNGGSFHSYVTVYQRVGQMYGKRILSGYYLDIVK